MSSVKVGGVWQPIVQWWTKVAGTWQPVAQAYEKVTGVWQLVYSALAPVTYTFTSGSGNQAIPAGCTSVTVQAIGYGNNGGNSYNDGISLFFWGGGGGGGGGSSVTRAVAAGDWGGNVAYSVAPNAGSNTTASASLVSGAFAITANPGVFGGDASAFGDGTGGAGGGASGGDVNTPGDAGASGGSGGIGGNAGIITGSSYGFGGNGGDPTGPGPTLGETAAVIITFS